MKLLIKDTCSWKESYGKSRQHTKKQRHHFANKDPYSQSYGFSSSHVRIWKLDHKEGWVPQNWCFLIVVLRRLLRALGLQGDQTSQSKRKSTLNIHWKDWCWIWSSNTLVTRCKEVTHWKRPWCWEKLRAGGKGGNRGWDDWMVSLTQCTWVWTISRR